MSDEILPAFDLLIAAQHRRARARIRSFFVALFQHYDVTINPFQDTQIYPHIRGMLDGSMLAIILTTCSDDGNEPYMILKALDELYKNHTGFAIIRRRREQVVRN